MNELETLIQTENELEEATEAYEELRKSIICLPVAILESSEEKLHS